jgi:signal transduction histidine kinase
MKIMLVVKDSVFSQAKMQQFQLIAFDEQQRQQQLQATEERYHNKIKLYALMTALAIFLLLAFILYRNNQQKQKANALLQQQKEKVEQTLTELKATQAQLVQREKMASLGELTAGIAHEIQNPLNFVNNFSDVNREMIDELQTELKTGNTEEAIAISNDIKENEEKINHHGKRADAIVKGMLQHSRVNTGKKELTDINALADEYLRLSYHGLRAKDKDFNADFKTDFDESIGKIEVVPQDIGRVLLNLYNNAFYSVNEKKKASTLKGENYEPTVWVTTKRISSPPVGGAGGLQITVKDNGPGIPSNIIDKIFQPFFTTKPTGQGTGLGLSLSYDIIKAHGGELKVETKEGEGAEFIIVLKNQN